MKRILFATIIALLPSTLAQASPTHLMAVDGPVLAGLRISSDDQVQFTFSYTGFLYACQPPGYDGTPLTAVFTFGVGDGKFPYTVKLGRTCTTPWSYMLPAEAALGLYEDFGSNTNELWRHLRKQVFELGAPVGVAIQNDLGHWDSRHGQNYQLSFQVSSNR